MVCGISCRPVSVDPGFVLCQCSRVRGSEVALRANSNADDKVDVAPPRRRFLLPGRSFDGSSSRTWLNVPINREGRAPRQLRLRMPRRSGEVLTRFQVALGSHPKRGTETKLLIPRTHTIYSARMRSHGGEGKPLRGPRLRSDGRLRGDRLRAQAHGPPQPPLRTEALQRAARGDGHVPELAHEDVEGTRGGRDRGAEGPSGPAGRGRVPPVAERRGALRGDSGPGAVGDPLGHEFRSSRGDTMSQFTSTNASDVRFKRELQPDL